MPITSWNMAVMSCKNVVGALQSPCYITLLSNVPKTIAKVVLWTSLGLMWICSYALDRLIFEWNFAQVTFIWISSWSRNRVTSFIVLSFRWWQSTTVLSFPIFFGMQRSGTACGTAFGIHQLASEYACNFSKSCGHIALGHWGKWWVYYLSLSISRILWLISCKGGSSSGTPLRMSLYFANHCLQSLW